MRLILRIITACLNYCNIVLRDLLDERIQNAVAWLVFPVSLHEHVSPAQIQLH
jgi:hypothetical protein